MLLWGFIVCSGLVVAEDAEALLGSLSRLDDYRSAGPADPETLTNALLAGSLLVPLGVPLKRVAAPNPAWRRRGGKF